MDLKIPMVCAKDGKEKFVFILDADTEPKPSVCDDGNADAVCVGDCLRIAVEKTLRKFSD